MRCYLVRSFLYLATMVGLAAMWLAIAPSAGSSSAELLLLWLGSVCVVAALQHVVNGLQVASWVWVLASAIGAGLAVFTLVPLTLKGLEDFESYERHPLRDCVDASVLGAIFGVVLGGVQSFALERGRVRWVLASALGCAAAAALVAFPEAWARPGFTRGLAMAVWAASAASASEPR